MNLEQFKRKYMAEGFRLGYKKFLTEANDDIPEEVQEMIDAMEESLSEEQSFINSLSDGDVIKEYFIKALFVSIKKVLPRFELSMYRRKLQNKEEVIKKLFWQVGSDFIKMTRRKKLSPKAIFNSIKSYSFLNELFILLGFGENEKNLINFAWQIFAASASALGFANIELAFPKR